MARQQTAGNQLSPEGTLGVNSTLGELARPAARENLTAIINKLPRLERLVLSLLYVENLTLAETAAVIEIKESKLSLIQRRVIRELQRALKQA